ncbi:MAG: EamA family transporter [Paludibacteraceae bacterium]|nr:EamA family transporter [Paludibacteraceae bacterium]
MGKLIILSILQSSLLAGGQVFLKMALVRMEPWGWNKEFWVSVFANWHFALCGLCFLGGSLLWMYIVKNFPLSIAYPLTSLSYVIGVVAAMLLFNESIPVVRWVGLFFIITGCCLVVK